jgi:hypothetical protein
MITTGKEYNEPRLVRPGLESNELFNNIEWKPKKKDIWTKDDLYIIDDSSEEINPTFKIYLNKDPLIKKNPELKNFNLAIIYEHSILKQSLSLYDMTISEINDTEFEIPFNLKEKLCWDVNSSIFFAAYSNTDQADENMQYGQIISKRNFKFALTKETTNLFNPKPCTPEEFEERGYSKKTAFIPVIDSSLLNLPFDECTNVVEILIAKDLHEVGESPVFINSVANTTIEEILISGYKEYNYGDLDDDSILKALTIRVARSAGLKDPSQIERDINDKHSAKIKSYIQHGFNYKNILKGLLAK